MNNKAWALVGMVSLAFCVGETARAGSAPVVVGLYRGFEGDTSSDVTGLIGWFVQSAINEGDARRAATLAGNVQGFDVPAALRKAMSCAAAPSAASECSDVRVVDAGGWAIADLGRNAAVEDELRSLGTTQAVVIHFVPILDRKGFHTYAWIQQAQIDSKVTYVPRLMAEYESPLPDGAARDTHWSSGQPTKTETAFAEAIAESAAMLGWMLQQFDESRSRSPGRAWSGLPRLKDSSAAAGRRCHAACSQPLVSDKDARVWVGTRTGIYPTLISHAKADVFR